MDRKAGSVSLLQEATLSRDSSLGIWMFIFDIRKDGVPVRPTIMSRRPKTRNGVLITTDILEHYVLETMP